MVRKSWPKYLEIVTNTAVLVVAIALLAALISARFESRVKPTFDRGLHSGQVVPTLPGIDYRAADRTLLISLNTNCGYCQKSLPFYKRLVEEQQKSTHNIAVVAVFPNSESDVQEYQARNHLDLKFVADVNARSM